MKYKNDISELIKKRYSCRTFQNKTLDLITKNELKTACRSVTNGLFDEKINLHFIERTGDNKWNSWEGGFDYILNPRYFIAGTIQNLQFAYESYGYYVEQIVLKATDIDLGTCWIGYFDQGFFHEVQVHSDEIFPAIIILGYPAEKRALIDILNRKLYSGVNKRNKWDQMFFIKDFNNPLTKDKADKFCEPLDMLRLAPSSGNTQPWRVVKEVNANNFHFYKKTVSYHYELKKLHNIDIGIAMCHFNLMARNLKRCGSWKQLAPDIVAPVNTDYIISWVETVN